MPLPTKEEFCSGDWISLLVLIVCLTISGVGIFIWMAADSFSDKTGLSVAVLFIFLAVTQVLFAVFWWIAKQKKDKEQFNKKSALNIQGEEETKFLSTKQE